MAPLDVDPSWSVQEQRETLANACACVESQLTFQDVRAHTGLVVKRGLLVGLLAIAACSSGHGRPPGADAQVLPDSAANSGNAGSGGANGAGGNPGLGGRSGGADAGNHGGTGSASNSRFDSGLDSSSDGATGSAADAGDAGQGTGGKPVDPGESVLERNKHPSRDGAFVEPTMSFTAAAGLSGDTGFKATFPGMVYASPLFLDRGPTEKGLFFIVTTSNDVFAFDETTGAIVWQKNIGPSPSATGVACGNVHPLGIVSTPVIDASAGTIYVAGAVGTSSIERHEVHALSVTDGAERSGFPIVVSPTSGGTTFVPTVQNQRSALSLVNGVLYVPYGGHNGDCGPYHGWVFAIDTKNPARTGAWATLGVGEGIWAAGGMASDGVGVFAITGNSTVGAMDHLSSDSEQVVRITGLGALERADKNIFFPSYWHALDAADADYGSSSPVYVATPGSVPEHVLATLTKSGHFLLLDPANLGGMGGELVDFPITTTPSSVNTVPSAYRSAKGVHVVLSTFNGAICPVPSATGHVIMSILLSPGAPPEPKVEWCYDVRGPLQGTIATTTDGVSNPIVWFMNNNSITGVNGDTGAPVVTSSRNVCRGYRQWTSPIAVKGRIVVAGDTNLCSWSVPK